MSFFNLYIAAKQAIGLLVGGTHHLPILKPNGEFDIISTNRLLNQLPPAQTTVPILAGPGPTGGVHPFPNPSQPPPEKEGVITVTGSMDFDTIGSLPADTKQIFIFAGSGTILTGGTIRNVPTGGIAFAPNDTLTVRVLSADTATRFRVDGVADDWTERGTFNGKPYYNREDQPDDAGGDHSTWWDGTVWKRSNGGGVVDTGTGVTDFPWGATGWATEPVALPEVEIMQFVRKSGYPTISDDLSHKTGRGTGNAPPHAKTDDFTSIGLDPKWDPITDTDAPGLSNSILQVGKWVDGMGALDPSKMYGYEQVADGPDLGADWTMVTKVMKNQGNDSFNLDSTLQVGIFVRLHDDTVKFVRTNGAEFALEHWTTFTAYDTASGVAYFTPDTHGTVYDWVYFKISHNFVTSELSFYASHNGVVWVPVVTPIDITGNPPAAVGIGLNASDDSVDRIGYWDWFKFYFGASVRIIGG